MKKRIIMHPAMLSLLCWGFFLISCTPGAALSQTAFPQNITSTFGPEPMTQHNFTWVTSTASKSGRIQYCIKSQFTGFGSQNILAQAAKSYEATTDSDHRMIHKAMLTNLRPGTDYVYRVGTPGCYSEQGVFRTAGQAANSFTFLHITDTQGSNAKDYALWKNTIDKALGKFPAARFLIHTGDLTDNGQKIQQWDLFAGAAKKELMDLTIVPAVGNHDALNGNKTNTNAKNFIDTFCLPQAPNTGAPAGTAYSFDYGNAHIAVMNTQCGSGNLQLQAVWLKQDMLRSRKTWKIVALHRGPYGATHDSVDIRKAWTPVFDVAGVDLVLQGHDHNYVRSYPLKNGARVANGKGTLYLTSDAGGVKFYPKKARTWQAADLQPYTQMYLAVTVQGNKVLIQAYDVQNHLRDSVTLQKSA